MQSIPLNNIPLNYIIPFILSGAIDTSLSNGSLIIRGELYKNEDIKPHNLYQSSLKDFNLLFSFYIYKVDKNIYKNSRGRSGKFTFV